MKLKIYIFLLFLSFSLKAKEHFVSFIIPCYNCASTVKESIDSIYKQNLKFPFEVVCTDDGSRDKTLKVLKKCQKKHSNLFVYAHKTNKGGGAARNTCVQKSRGDLIFCLDSDNVLCPRSVNNLINLIDESGCDVASFEEGRGFINNYVVVIAIMFSVPGHTYDLYNWINNQVRNPANGGNYLFTRQSYDRAGGYPEDVGSADTFGFGIAQLATGSVMKTLPRTYYWHRLHSDSYYMRESKSNTSNRCKVLKNFSEIFSLESQKKLYQENQEEMWNEFGNLGKKIFTLASPEIIQSLFKAYSHKYKKQYADAAVEFNNAISFGCTSPKIIQYAEEMHRLSKNK